MIETSTQHLIFKDEVLTIVIDSTKSLLQLTWLQHPDSEQYRKGYRLAILIAFAHKVKYWLTDSRQVPYVLLADQYWMYTKMRPLLKGGKLHKVAIVLQPETLMMTDQKPTLENPERMAKSEKLFNLDFFLDIASALLWFQEGNQEY